MTVTPSRASYSHRAGLAYSQFYTSEKEIFDAGKTYPFRDGALKSLALDPKVRVGWQKSGGAYNHRPETLEKSYMESKVRCSRGLTSSMQKSFGTREEHHINLTLARHIQEHVQGSDG